MPRQLPVLHSCHRGASNTNRTERRNYLPDFVRIGASVCMSTVSWEATTLAATNTIISVNGGAPISRDQTNIIVTMVGAPTAGPVFEWCRQSGFVRDSDTQFRFNFTVAGGHVRGYDTL